MDTTLRAALHAARQQHRSGAGTVLDVLLRSPGVPPARWRDTLREHAGIEVVDVDADAQPDFSRIDAEQARAWQCVALMGQPTRLAMADPWDDAALRRASKALAATPRLAAVSTPWLARWGLAGGAAGGAPGDAADRSGRRDGSVGGPVVEFVDAALRAAYHDGASDVHFECDRQGITVKLRQDGVMARFARMDNPQRAEEVISRIKVLAQLDITERRVPQDGRFRHGFDGASVDLRVSIMPSVFGEDAVLRLLDKAQLRSRDRSATLDRLGFDEPNARRIRALAERPHGMLLVTGPTGSGKTTTVYAVLSEINTGLEKIITIEDPVEYELPGVLQIPVNERKGLTFAKGLRSILRHDPDRILVGEIRDAETAEIAVQSALTGHQVFTTVHANSIFDVMGRFRHFGLDMFGFVSSLNGVVVQRLLRQVCPHCAGRRPVLPGESAWLAGHGLAADEVAQAVGCEHCHGSGYKGRAVLAEVHGIDDRFRDLVATGGAISELRSHVAASGVVALPLAAARAVVSGATTPEEVKRVVGWL